MRVVDGVVANTISNSVSLGIPPLIDFINYVINLDKNTRVLEDKLSRMKNHVEAMSSKLQLDQKSSKEVFVQKWLQNIYDQVKNGRDVIDCSHQILYNLVNTRTYLHRWVIFV